MCDAKNRVSNAATAAPFHRVYVYGLLNRNSLSMCTCVHVYIVNHLRCYYGVCMHIVSC